MNHLKVKLIFALVASLILSSCQGLTPIAKIQAAPPKTPTEDPYKPPKETLVSIPTSPKQPQNGLPTKQPTIRRPKIWTADLNAGEISLAVLSPDGKTIAIRGLKGVELFNLDAPIRYLGRMSILANGLVFHPDGQSLAIAHDGILQFWDLKNGTIKYFWGSTRSDIGRVRGYVSFSPDGKYIGYWATSICDGLGGKFEIRNVKTGELLIERKACADWFNPTFTFSRDSKKLILGYMDDTLPLDSPPVYVEVIDMSTLKTTIYLPGVLVVAASNDGHTVAAYEKNDFYANENNIILIDLEKNEQVAKIALPDQFLSFAPDGDHFLFKRDGKIYMQSLQTGQITCDFGEFGDAAWISFSQNGKRFIVWNYEVIYPVEMSMCSTQNE